MRSSFSHLGLIILLLFGAFWLASSALDQQSFWGDEGWSMWAVGGRNPLETLRRVGDDVHPPLYFVLLDGWIALAGESVYAVRMLSLLFGLIGLAATFALARRLFDRQTGLIALGLSGTTSFWVYYTREARMYTLLLALGVLATWAYLRWLEDSSRRRTLIYALLLALLPYTHYHGALMIATHGLHLLLTHPRRWRQWCAPATLAALLYAPWIPLGLRQIQEHPDGPFAIPIPTSRQTITGLIGHLIGGHWGLLPLPFAAVAIGWRIRRQTRVFVLLVIWLILTPGIVFWVNAEIMPFYQRRYVIAILPAMILVQAYGLRWIPWRWAAVALLGVVMVGQVRSYDSLWPPKPSWKPALARMVAARDPAEPIFTLIIPNSVEAYYDRQLGIRQGTVFDLNDHSLDPAALVKSVEDAPAVWVAMPANLYATWNVIALLDAGGSATYRDSAANFVLYRFEPGDTDDLFFQFGDLIAYRGAVGEQFVAHAGDTLCMELPLMAVAALPPEGRYSAGLHLVGDSNQVISQWDGGVGVYAAGENFILQPCLTIPDSTPGWDYHLVLVIYDWMTGDRLGLLDMANPAAPVGWLDTLVIGVVKVR
ncbi:MAG: glycosyltransferase family 39 protein [Chloroflexi bacterium]|nr:glycosyltransferase family 39 protein [Chloroflexota bacterium]